MEKCDFCNDVGFKDLNSMEGSAHHSESRKRLADNDGDHNESSENVEYMDTSEENFFCIQKVQDLQIFKD